MTILPSLATINEGDGSSGSPIAVTLSLLLEPSSVLLDHVVPEIPKLLPNRAPFASYADLLDVTFQVISALDVKEKAEFIAGHPRIGETKNLSNLSAREQGATQTTNSTPPEVLARLGHLNACYEKKYPGLRYITFVNGRSRAAIVEEMEDKLGFEHSLSPTYPSIESLDPVDVEAEDWMTELEGAIVDVGKIAKSRLVGLGVE
ncbi:hypothetical protein BDN71DRAFT_1442031 [Pleurotus eryngii]|uniref:Oxo-4-hydroxy-4-carboxy-5-ureidoimidazoline decarboxylase domain-containing protein n=1 Tax=Pleurotus eryngii TaxID=5323 RepID=A0A9P6A528_PLEER|nr:hypothetical protein BDN71DRAFT_1442031 [Pleurotus eryngii]